MATKHRDLSVRSGASDRSSCSLLIEVGIRRMYGELFAIRVRKASQIANGLEFDRTSLVVAGQIDAIRRNWHKLTWTVA